MMTIIFTSDHEIHGNGDGNPMDLIVNPTYRMMDLFEKYGAKLTIFADVAEIQKFKEFYSSTGIDKFSVKEIETQLVDAVKKGHDVQLHVHSSYYSSFFNGHRWEQNYEEYDLARLSRTRLMQIIGEGKEYLEQLIRANNKDYICNVFRAANWSMMPSAAITRVLVENGIKIDSSVFKFGKRKGLVNFDYSSAYSHLLPWPISLDNVCNKDSESPLFEIPIYTEARSLLSFVTINRLYRVLNSRMHPLVNPPKSSGSLEDKKHVSLLSKLVGKHAFKADFNQCNGTQLIKSLMHAEKDFSDVENDVPFVLIGHSKLFSKWNERTLSPFLEYVAKNPGRYRFGLYSDIDLNNFKNY